MKFPVLLSVGLLIICGCIQKEKQCSSAYVKIPGAATFVGYGTADLDTIWLNRYIRGSHFTQLNRRDTMLYTDISLLHDTAYQSGGEFFKLFEGDELEIIVPATAQLFRVSGLSYHGDSIYYYRSHEGFCDMKTAPLLPPDSITINGQRTPMIFSKGTLKVAYLKK